MDEIKKNHIVQISLKDGKTVDGTVFDYAQDRILVLVSLSSIDEAIELKELDDIKVVVHTHLGLKKMNSTVLSELNKKHEILIENAPTVEVIQKREFVRVISDLNFTILKDDEKIECICLNISAGGVAFIPHVHNLQIDDEIKIIFPENEFEQEITCNAKIIKSKNESFVAKYLDLDKYDEDKITKYVFKKITDK